MRFANSTTIRIWNSFIGVDGTLPTVSGTPTVTIYNADALVESGNMTNNANTDYYYDFTIPAAANTVYCVYLQATYSTGENVKGAVVFIAGDPETTNLYALFVGQDGQAITVTSPTVSVWEGSTQHLNGGALTQITGSLYYNTMSNALSDGSVFHVVTTATYSGSSIYGQYVVGGKFAAAGSGYSSTVSVRSVNPRMEVRSPQTSKIKVK